jgi:hypothetical protein
MSLRRIFRRQAFALARFFSKVASPLEGVNDTSQGERLRLHPRIWLRHFLTAPHVKKIAYVAPCLTQASMLYAVVLDRSHERV